MLTSYVPYQSLSSTQKESTIFEQVYGRRRCRRPNSINLNVQWIPVTDRTSTNRWSTSEINNRKFKTETFFDNNAMRAQNQPKAVTPPSSDYTDAYLNAFAPKPLPTRRIYRINAPAFANFAPLRTNLSMNSSIKTSETRFNNINNNNRTSNLFNRIVSPLTTSNSTYSSSFTPDIFPKYEPLSRTQSSSSKPQTYNSNDSTIFHNRPTSETTIHTSSPTIPIDRSGSPDKNAHKPIPSNSLQSYPSSPTTPSSSSPTKLTYKPSVSFQSPPLSLPFSNNNQQSSTTNQTVLPTSNTDKHINRPETLLFQSDEDIYQPSIEKPSPILTPLLESPITRLDSKIESKHAPTEELSTISSKPIEILEKTLSKYDTIIDQISEVLASVSPLSSTISSMSPGKSVLDYELTSDGSPILQRKHIESQSSQQSATTSIKNTNIPRIKGKHLIRDDSYDKIITAIADLDNELTPPPDAQKPTTTVIEEEKEEPMTPLLEDHQISSTSELHPLNQTKLDEEKLVDVQSTTEVRSDNANFDQQCQDKDINEPNVEIITNKNNEKCVTWRENVPVNDDDESSLCLSSTEEGSLSETPITMTQKEQVTSQKFPTSIESSNLNDQQKFSAEFTESSTKTIERQNKFASSSEQSSSFSDSVDRETTPSDLNESRTSHEEQIPSSRDSADTQFVSVIDSSNKNTSIVDKQSPTSSDVIIKENTNLQVEKIESDKTETPMQLVDIIENEAKTPTIEEIPLLSLPIIESPIHTLTDSISTRYISSDVYHGYIGDHATFKESPSDIDTNNMKTSLCQTVAPSATPLIEATQSVISSGRTLTATQPLKNETEAIDQSQNEATHVTPMTTDSNEKNDEHEPETKENKLTMDTSKDSETTFESLHDIITELTNKQEVQSTASTELVSEIFISAKDAKDLTTLETTPANDITCSSIEKIDEIESTPSSLFDTIQNVISTDIPSLQTRITEVEESIESPPPMNVTTLASTPSSEVPTLSFVENKITENKDDEQVFTNEKVTQINVPPEASDIPTISQKVDDSQISLDKTSHPPITSTETIDTYISFSSTEENLPLVKQDFTSTNDQTDTEQFKSTETIPDQSFTHQQSFEIVTTDKPNTQLVSTEPTMVEFTSSLKTDELASTSNKQNKIIEKIIHELINDIIHTAISQLPYDSIERTQDNLPSDNSLIQSIISQIDDVIQQSTIESQSDSVSVKTEIETLPLKFSVNYRETSPTNTELDSLELIHALQGHSIILLNSSEQIYQPPEKSSSTTTSSQITSSDRYVSYAIHQMGDSSQERLPSLPIAADLPIYKNIDKDAIPKPIAQDNQLIIKEDDSTEYDATENLTSNSDDIILQRLFPSKTNRQKYFDTSSTDDDVDDEIEQHDLTDLEHIIDKLKQTNINLNTNEEPYQRYDLATTPSSNDSSSSSKQQVDDVYFIPGYAGLWRPSVENDNTDLPIDYDADDERISSTKTRTIIRTLNSTKRPLVFEYPQNQSETLTTGVPLRPNSIDLHNQSINDYLYDISESDSYQTCPSSISKPIKSSEEKHQTSSEENIYLIRENERGVSLPITMKIDCDDITFRLSTSSPINTQLYSNIPSDLSSPSTHSEPPLPIKTNPNSPMNSPLSNDQQKLSSWLNTVNTITTTLEAPTSHVKLYKSAKGPISISEYHPQGYYIIIENTSRSKTIDLKNWKIQQENDYNNSLTFIFPDHYLLKPNHSLKILSNTNQSEQRHDDLIALSISSWHTGANILTTLINPEGKACATLTKKTIISD